MDRRKRIILIVAAVLAVIGVIALLMRPKRAVEAPTQAVTDPTAVGSAGALARSSGIVNSSVSEAEAPTPPAPLSAAVAVKQLALTFAERFGSFSSEGNFVNVEDLYPLMTERYQRQSEENITRQRAMASSGGLGFQSITTIAISSVAELPNGEESREATVRVSTQRTAVTAGAMPRTYGQELVVKLLKVGDEWRVDDAR